jgi:hypothetical protein
MATIIDALITQITLDPKGYQKGEAQVRQANKQIKDDIRDLEDKIAAIRLKSTKDTRAQDNAQIASHREVIRQKRRSLEDNRGREIEQIKRTKEQTASLGILKNAAAELFAVFGVATTAGAFVKFVLDVNNADAATGRFADNLGEDAMAVNAFGAVIEGLGGKADDAKAAFANLAAIRFAMQAKGDYSKAPVLSRLGVSPEDLNDLDAAMRKIAATFKTMPRSRFYQYAREAGFSDSVINALALGDVELAKRLEEAKRREALTAEQIRRSQELQRRGADIGSAFRGRTRGAQDVAVGEWEALQLLLQGHVKEARERYDRAHRENKKSVDEFWRDMGNALFGKHNPGPAAAGGGAPSAELTSRRSKFAIDYLKSQGISNPATLGSIAGSLAESGLDPNKVNPKSGAFGIGQWVGARKAALFAKYGPHPTFDQQLRFLVSELKGGDRGGASVLAAKTAWAAAVAYITRFMRPAPGADTIGDLQRASRALRRMGVPVIDPGMNLGAGLATSHHPTIVTRTATVQNDVSIGRIEVNVPAGSDGQRIASDTAAAVRKQPFVAMANTGLA